MAAKSNADLTAENIAVVSGQTTPESITPTTLGGELQDIIDSMYNNVDTPLTRTQTFADNAAKTSAVPDFIGQKGTQLDTNISYVSNGLLAGNWVLPANTQVQSDTYAVASGIDTYAATLTPALAVYAAGNSFKIKFTNANTGAASIEVNGLAAKAIKKNGSVALVAGDIQAGSIYTLTFDGTNFQIDNSGYAASKGYKKYSAIVSQVGTDPPTDIVLENTLGGTIVWSYNSAGNYKATLAGAMTANKTIVFLTAGILGATILQGHADSINTIQITSIVSNTGVATNGIMQTSSIEIRVYP